MVRPEKRALPIECKYSSSAEYVGRNGYQQAATYLAEARSGLASLAVILVIGPDDVVSGTGTTQTVIGHVSVAPVSALTGLLREFLDG